MTWPLDQPLAPQLARSRTDLPAGPDWAYEPKWDGFRAIAFVEGATIELQSRSGRPLRRYFPELAFPDGRYVLDGEIVIVGSDGRSQFDLLQQRLHPAASRVERLASETPARYVAFDLLARDEVSLLDLSFAERRSALAGLLGVGAGSLVPGSTVELAESVRDAEYAARWLRSAEGVVAKQLSAPYRPGERTGMVKIKRVRTIDCVVVGWRPGKEPDTVGSLILGLYDPVGDLHVVGHSSGLSAKRKRELVAELAPYGTGARGSGDPSRWSSERELEWVELRPELVVEVTFDHVSDGRIRHGTKIVRWREDRDPRSCLLAQLES
jgi:ATP-dependent DNA ligase